MEFIMGNCAFLWSQKNLILFFLNIFSGDFSHKLGFWHRLIIPV
jgi:hypothetical protein